MVMQRKDNNLKGEKKAIIRNPMSGTKTQERTSFVLGHFDVQLSCDRVTNLDHLIKVPKLMRYDLLASERKLFVR